MNKSFGDQSDEGTPGLIPNPEVKLVSADGTWWATAWESGSLPRDFSLSSSARQHNAGGLFDSIFSNRLLK